MNYILCIICSILLRAGLCAVIPNAFLPPQRRQSTNSGLYSPQDKVISISYLTINESIYEQNHGIEIEFYNSFCGHCKNFAPIYKQYAIDIYAWRDIVKIGAVDCANDDNNDLCRNFEIMGYPTLRYFPPFYQKGDKQFGLKIDNEPGTVGHSSLIGLLMNQASPPSHWPRLHPIQFQDKDRLFTDEPDTVQFIFLLYDTRNESTVAQDVALDYHKISEISVRQVASAAVAVGLGLSAHPALYVVQRNKLDVENIPTAELNRTMIGGTIKSYIVSHGIAGPDEIAELATTSSSTTSPPVNIVDEVSEGQDAAIVNQVKERYDVVYQADIEKAIQYSIFHELVQINEISSERFGALHRYLNVLKRYSPLGANGRNFLNELSEFVSHSSDLNGERLEKEINALEQKWHPIFSSNRYVGCQGSAQGLRGFTCGLWVLFHHITVQSANADNKNDPLEALRAIHGYVKHFFGCTGCSKHFQEMASRNHIWNVTSRDEAVLWLWSAHNEVNNRIAGDKTEDPVFPKIPFPHEKACSTCHSSDSADQNWNRSEVLGFLKRIHSPENLSRLGADDDSALPESLESLRAKRQIGNMFNDMDLRMGIFLYACCMGIIIVAVKLFLKRGYRKKLYMHDILGKV